MDCGFGGGVSLPGSPSANQIASEAGLGSSTAGDIATGITGELSNSLRPLVIGAALQRADFYTAWQFYKIPEYVPANSTQAKAARVTFWASLLIPFGGEEAGAGKIGRKVAMEVHHLLPREFAAIFEKLGFDIEKYTIKMPKGEHRLSEFAGLHTNAGGNWNKFWERFFDNPANHTKEGVLDQLFKMLRDFNVRGTM